MLSVVHVGKFYPPVAGGMERVVASLCEATRGRLASRVIAFHTEPRTREDVVDGVPVVRVATWGSAGSVPIAPSLAGHLRRARADVVVLHEPNPWALLSWTAAAPRIPLVIWFHSEVVRPQLQYRLLYEPVARPAYRRARRFVVSSPALADAARTLNAYRDRISIVPFGLDAARWAPAADVLAEADRLRASAGGAPIVLFAGRHVPYKGVDVLIRAARDLAATVIVAGDGPMRAAWQRLAAARKGSARFVFTGELPDRALHAHFLACDVFVLPSVTRAEAFGFVQLEAMACGKPVVSTGVPTGVPWVNRDGETGMVVPPGDSEALGAALGTLIADRRLRDTMGCAGRRRVHEQFSLRAMGDGLVDVCTRAASS